MIMKLIKKFESVNFIAQTGDGYARWASKDLHTKDAVQLTVSDEAGKVVFVRICEKDGVYTKTLADCRAVCERDYKWFANKR